MSNKPDAPFLSPGDRQTLIRLEQVSVSYHAPRERIRTIKEYAIRTLKGGVTHQEFQALSEVSFDVRAGEVFGIVGRNGAGKSTLLKVISRVLRPTSGRVQVEGHVAPLLELGAGFHSELSGRENIFLNGTLLGLKRAEIESAFDEIVDFAELWDFVDAPLRTYSTGMAVRLGFSVATAFRPDILLVDEVLSVGDERFQEKCAARMTEFRQQGTTILLVTHDSRLVMSMCDRALWLDHGRVGAVGPVDQVISAYHAAADRLQPQRRAKKKTLPAKNTPIQSSSPVPSNHLEELALDRVWFYRFDLPSGRQTASELADEVVKIHDTRWQMLKAALEPLCDGDWSKLTCLDLGCNQGYFAFQLARLGCRQVVGVDARAAHISDANLLSRVWGLSNLHFYNLDLFKLSPRDFEKFDVVLLFGLLYQLENPIGALRQAQALASRAIIIETQLAPDLQGRIEWGAADNFIPLQGSFAILDRTQDVNSPVGSLTPISLCPGRDSLLWMVRKLGFARVEVLPPPEDAYEQFVAGKRVMILGEV